MRDDELFLIDAEEFIESDYQWRQLEEENEAEEREYWFLVKRFGNHVVKEPLNIQRYVQEWISLNYNENKYAVNESQFI